MTDRSHVSVSQSINQVTYFGYNGTITEFTRLQIIVESGFHVQRRNEGVNYNSEYRVV